MNTAEKIIAKFGDQSSLARLLGKRQSTVQYWASSGNIPARWHKELLRLAKKNNIELSPTDFSPFDVDLSETYQKTPPSTDSDVPARIPMAKWNGILVLGETEIPCHVLDTGQRVISRRAATDYLTEKRGGGNLEHYINVQALKKYMPSDISSEMIDFSLENVVHKRVKGLSADTFITICNAYVKALSEGALETDTQKSTAIQAAMFISACAKVGLIALIDEATGYQYDRPVDALQLKLKAFLEEDARKWERTFPEELWTEFGRLTHWKGKGSNSQRPKYWGKLVMELIYDYLDKDVADWLRDNAPKPKHGQNYHQWLSSQFGLQKLIQHIWIVVGMARTCNSLTELRFKMADSFNRQPVLFTYFLETPQPELEQSNTGRKKVAKRTASDGDTSEAETSNMELPL